MNPSGRCRGSGAARFVGYHGYMNRGKSCGAGAPEGREVSRQVGRRAAILSGLLSWVLAAGPAAAGDSGPLNVFAAASLTDLVNRLDDGFCTEQGRGPGCTRGVFGASSILARQVAQGAPADVYLTAHEEWMDFLESSGRIEPGSRVVFAGNRLVVVQPVGARVETDPIAALSGGRIAVADPDHVPAGRYAREALRSLGLWDTLGGQIIPADNVRQALFLVARGEVSAGIVYLSDALASARVSVVAILPETLHSPIRYTAAVLRGGEPGAREFVRFLGGPRAGVTLTELGFETARASND